MSEERSDPTADPVRDALRELAAIEDVPSSRLDTLLERLEADLPLGPPGEPHSGPKPTRAVNPKLGPFASAALGLGAGALVGAAAMHAYDARHPVTRTIEVEKIVTVVAPSPSSPPLKDVPVENVPAPSPSTPARPSSASSASSSTEERRLVDDARSAYARGDLDLARARLDEHQGRFPSGVLSEEREALAVRVAVSAARFDEARRRGERFRARYPKSLMLPAVEAALASIP